MMHVACSTSADTSQFDYAKRIKNRIATRKAKIGVVGLGYVGLPFAVEKANVGFDVVGIELNAQRVARVNKSDSYISDVSDVALHKAVESGRLRACSSFQAVTDMDVIVVCVPTPLTKNLTPDL
ncbi:MAG: NAD(P)-binding domain-containing protein, partial [Phormidesmis sp.]